MIIMKQKTLKEAVEFNGIGLHTGKDVNMRLVPAEVDTGVVFVKTHKDNKKLPLLLENVQGEARGTNLYVGEEAVNTFEHLLAAFGAHQVNNVYVEMNADEPPIMDGSSQLFYEKILEVGTVEQDAEAPVYKVVKPCMVEENGAVLMAWPDDKFRIEYTVDYPNTLIGTQQVGVSFERDETATEMMSARTFCLYKEVELQRKHNLALGGSLENAIVVNDYEIMNEEGLRHEKEFAWHKANDLFGDLRIMGGYIQGRFVGSRSGHRQNIALLKKMLKENCIVKENIWMDKQVLEFHEIQNILPHRYPFLLVDRIIEMEVGKSATGIKNVTGNEEFFNGHFPGAPVMPGVLIVEAMAQVAGVCLLSITDNRGKIPYFMALEQVKFRKPVYPGDQLQLEIKVLKMRRNTGKVEAVAKVNGDVHVEGKLSFMIR
jgi:UDP-3-O-[3-hydroxymyristoyl] N-acetylglucosamine deacetylase/3-hydroxyacyl-[acyl-carrier-protein] dehydratase